jgi:hypothetical protein
MDWSATPEMHTQFQHQLIDTSDTAPAHHSMEMDHQMEQAQGGNIGAGRGVGRLVAHFENKGFTHAPPLPPRPIPNAVSHIHQVQNQHQHQIQHQNQSPSMPFGGFNHMLDPNRVSSPIGSPADTNFGSWDAQSRLMSPLATSPGGMFPSSFHDGSRVASPATGPSSSDPFGSLDDFMSNDRMNNQMVNPMVASPSQSAPAAPGTPGFAIWRPPVPATPKPTQFQFNNSSSSVGNNNNSGNNNNNNNHSAGSGNFFKPPVPPKPVIPPGGNQFILEFNPGAKGKAKAVAKPARPRVVPPTSPAFDTVIKQEAPPTPMPADIPSSSASNAAVGIKSKIHIDDAQGGPLIMFKQTPTASSAAAAARPSREQVPAEAWEQFKTTIRGLYLEDRKPLKEVMSIMADKYGFQATPKMYKTRFSQWGFVKNNTEDEVKRLLSMKFQRDAEGKVSEFVRNGRVVNLGTYLKRKGVTEYDLVDFETPADLPAHVRCRTPTPPPAPDYLRSPDLLRAQELVVGNMRKAFLHCRQLEVETDAHIGWPSIMVWGAGSSDLLLEANFYFEAQDADQGGQCLMRAFKQLEMDLKKLSPQGIQELLLGMVNRDPGMMTALCKYLAAYSSTNFERSHPLRQIFTCLYEVQQKHGSTTLSDLLWASMPTIAEELEAIYGRRHPYVARAWADLALFYSHANLDRLDKLVVELRALQRQLEQRHGNDSVDVLTLRYAILQLLFAASPHSGATKEATVEYYQTLKSLGLIFPVRDSRPNVVCYHSVVKVDPWTKRCRRRYDSGVAMMEEHMGVRMHVYFEEDLHTVEHAPEPQDSWAAAMGQIGMKWGFI